MQSYRSRNRTSSLVEDLLVSALSHDGMETVEVRDLNAHEEAALIVTFANHGQDIQEERLNWKIRACYRLRRKYQFLYRTAAWSILFFHVFSRPLWTLRIGGTEDWNDASVYPSYELPYMPELASSLLIGLATLILWLSTLLEFGYHGRSRHQYFSVFFAVVLTLISITILMQLSYCVAGKIPDFSASPLYSLPILLVERRWDGNTLSLLRLMPRMTMLVLMVATTVCLFSCVALLILPKDSDEVTQYFGSFGDAVWNMLMMLNASNWPTPFMPAYDDNRAYALFFFAFIMVGDWCVLNIVLGFICMYFNQEQEATEAAEKKLFDKLYLRAFTLLDVERRGHVSYVTMDALLKEIYDFYESTMHPPTEEERFELILLLDPDSTGVVTYEQFVCLQERCLKAALRELRAKKAKVSRFIQASMENPRGSVADAYLPEGARVSISHYTEGEKATFSNSTLNDPVQLQKVMDASVYGKLDARIVDRVRQVSTSSRTTSGSFSSRKVSLATVSNPILQRSSVDHDAAALAVSPSAVMKKTVKTSIEIDSGHNSLAAFDGAPTSSGGQRASTTTAAAWSWLRLPTWSVVLLFVDSFYFDVAMDSLVDLIAIVSLAGSNCTVPFVVFAVFASVEVACKWYVKGWFRFSRSKRNALDGLMTFVYDVLLLVQSTQRFHTHRFCQNYGAHILLLLRIFLWPRNVLALNYYKSFRDKHRLAFQYAFKSLDKLLFLVVVMFVYIYGFAAFAQQIYGGAIVKTGETGAMIAASAYGAGGYWPFNYNDIPSGLVTTFVLLHVSNMNIITTGFSVARDNWAQALFTFAYVFGVLFLLNVLVAFIINQFVKYLDGLRLQRTREKRRAIKRVGRPQLQPLSAVPQALAPSASEELSRAESGADSRVSSQAAASNAAALLAKLYQDAQQLGVTDGDAAADGGHDDASSTPGGGHDSDEEQLAPSLRASLKLRVHTQRRRFALMDIQTLHSHVVSQDDDRAITVTLPVVQLESLLAMGQRGPFAAASATATATGDQHSGSSSGAVPAAPMTWWESWLLGQPLDMSPLAQATILLKFAQLGNEKHFQPTIVGYVCCLTRQRFGWLFQLAAVGYALLRFFARPLWTFQAAYVDTWHDGSVYPMSGMPLLSPAAEAAIKLPLLFVLLVGLALEIGYKEDVLSPAFSLRRLSPSRWLRFAMAFYCFLCMLLLVGALASDDFDQNAQRQRIVTGTSMGAMVFVLWFHRMSLVKLKVFLHILPRLALTIAVFVLIIVVFASFGPILMDDRSNQGSVSAESHDDDTYFDTFGNAVWSIFAAIAASTYPGQFIPIYQHHRDTALYFVAFITVGAFGMLNLVLVLVFVEFQRASKQMVRHMRKTRQQLLTQIFHLLANDRATAAAAPSSASSGAASLSLAIRRDTVAHLIDTLRGRYGDFERVGIAPEAAKALLVDVLDVHGDGGIHLDEFMYVLDVARIKLHVEKLSLHSAATATGRDSLSLGAAYDGADAEANNGDEGDDGGGAETRASMAMASPMRPTMVIDDADRPSWALPSPLSALASVTSPKAATAHAGPPLSSSSSSSSVASMSSAASSLSTASAALPPPPPIPAQVFRQVQVELQAMRPATEIVLDVAYDTAVVFLTVLTLSINATSLYAYSTAEYAILWAIAALRASQVGANVWWYGARRAFHTFRNVSDACLASVLAVLLLGDAASVRTQSVSGWILVARCVNVVQLVLALRLARSVLNWVYRRQLARLLTLSAMDATFYRVQADLRLLRYWQLLLLRFGRLFRRSFGRLQSLGIIFLCIGYAFAALGMVAFGGVISYTRTDADFLASPYVSNGFYAWNFNDFTSAVLLLGCCLHVSDFDVIASGFASSTNTVAARLYFAAWYLVGVLLLLNVVKAFFLTEFVVVFSDTKKSAAEAAAAAVGKTNAAATATAKATVASRSASKVTAVAASGGATHPAPSAV